MIARRLATAILAIVVAPAGVAAEPLRLRGDALATTAAPAGLLVLDGDLDRFMAAALSQRVTGEKVDVEDVE